MTPHESIGIWAGDSLQIEAQVFPEGATQKVIYSMQQIEGNYPFFVSPDGLVQAFEEGEAWIYAEVEGYPEVRTELYVGVFNAGPTEPEPESIIIGNIPSPENPVKVGEEFNLDIVITPGDASQELTLEPSIADDLLPGQVAYNDPFDGVLTGITPGKIYVRIYPSVLGSNSSIFQEFEFTVEE